MPRPVTTRRSRSAAGATGRRAALAVAALAVAGSGCVAFSVRGHVGAVTDGGRFGAQAGLTLGLGLTTGERTAVVASGGVATGDAPKLGIVDTLEYVRIPDRHERGRGFAWRAGFGGVLALIGDPTLLGLHLASVVVLRDKYDHSAGHEKMGGGGWSRSVAGVGLEGRAGLAIDTEPAADPTQADVSRNRFGSSLSVTFEWIMLMEQHLF